MSFQIFKRILLTSLLFDDESSTLYEQSCLSTCDTPKVEKNLAKCWILKIKCKCIYLLNRLICLVRTSCFLLPGVEVHLKFFVWSYVFKPSYGKSLVHELLHMKPSQTSNNEMNSTNGGQTADYDTTLLQYLFSLLLYKESRLQACELIESILLHMPMLNLNRIGNIHYILHTIDDDGLSCLCKVFAVTLSDLDLSEKKCWANAQKKQQLLVYQQQQQQLQANQNGNGSSQSSAATPSSSPGGGQQAVTTPQPKYVPIMPSIRDQNQELLLSIPTLLNRLVNLVRKKDYSVRFPDSSTEIENWIRYIDQALSDTDESDSDMPFNPAVRSLNSTGAGSTHNNNAPTATTNWANFQISDDNQLNQPALVAAAKLNNFVHVLYTLSLLLIGKERKRVQKSLAKLRLATALNSLFDYLIWNCRCEYPGGENNNQQQLRSHICPEVAVKIQFLRLVHSFCDHSE